MTIYERHTNGPPVMQLTSLSDKTLDVKSVMQSVKHVSMTWPKRDINCLAWKHKKTFICVSGFRRRHLFFLYQLDHLLLLHFGQSIEVHSLENKNKIPTPEVQTLCCFAWPTFVKLALENFILGHKKLSSRSGTGKEPNYYHPEVAPSLVVSGITALSSNKHYLCLKLHPWLQQSLVHLPQKPRGTLLCWECSCWNRLNTISQRKICQLTLISCPRWMQTILFP